jgi:uncharacterized protein (DUF2147 family)
MKIMKGFFVIAALVLASTAAQAQYTFEYGGRTIRIDPDRGTVSIPGVYDNSGRKSKRTRGDQESDRRRKQAPEQAKIDPQAPATDPAPAAPAPATQAPPPANTVSEPPAATATVAPTDTITSTEPPANPPPPQVQQDAAPAARPVPPPVVATAPPSAPLPKPVSPVQSANSPLGVWLTEEKEGKVRIEQCGNNLCGYSVDGKSNQNGEQVLIDMKPSKDKWSGRIFDPKSGSTYDSTIALKSPDTLRVQGCAFGGMFCGGQTWSRVN